MEQKLRYGIYALVIIIFQSILKLYGVILTGSISFLSESIDTLTDLVFVTITIYTIYQSQKPADYEHMYGHSRLDSVGSVIQGITLVNLYIFLIYNAIQVIISGTHDVTSPEVGLILLVISFIVNLLFSRFLIWKGKKINSLSLKIQGLNLFQDSMRAILVIFSLTLAIFGFAFLDPLFSIALSIWVIIGAIKITREGINDLTDVNPISSEVLEKFRLKIFNLEHVNGITDLKIRSSGKKLFLEVNILVEDHISIAHANRITKSIVFLSQQYFPLYEIENVIQMNSLSGEEDTGEEIINLISAKKVEFPEIIKIKELNLFTIEKQLIISFIIKVNAELSLEQAHEICSNFEKELMEENPTINRIITHIDSKIKKHEDLPKEISCETLEIDDMNKIESVIEFILRAYPEVKGFHGFECWNANNEYIMELHVFFNGSLNIVRVHDIITSIEEKIKSSIAIRNLSEIILHSEPIKGRTDGIFF